MLILSTILLITTATAAMPLRLALVGSVVASQVATIAVAASIVVKRGKFPTFSNDNDLTMSLLLSLILP